MIRSLYYHPNQPFRTQIPVEEFATLKQSGEGLLWVDLVDEPSDHSEAILRDQFNFHPLAIDDALRERHVPKLDDWKEYLYLVVHSVVCDWQGEKPVSNMELDVFMGENYLVTHQKKAISEIDQLWQLCQVNDRYFNRGPSHLFYRIADSMVNSYMAVTDELSEMLVEVEDQLFLNPKPELLEQIFTIKRAVINLRRIVIPQQLMFDKLSRDTFSVINPSDQIFFRDIYDHFARQAGLVESLHELILSALNIYLSVVNNGTNDVMKLLAIVTTLFMPLSFIVGFFGMNFFAAEQPLVNWTSQTVFDVMLLSMFITPIAMYLWIKWRGWV